MKVKITGASNFINRMFEAAGSFQWAREFLKNALEAEASRVEFGIEWEAVRKHNLYRRMITDNGLGMSKADLLRFFSTLGEGGKPIGGVHQNFGVGAKIAALPWNPNGVVVISYQGGVGSLIWIVLEEATGEYELVEFSNGGGKKTCVVDPAGMYTEGISWDKISPPWAREHGTTIVLLGSDEHPDTVLGNPDSNEKDIKGLSTYLNTRFWDLKKVDVQVQELRSTHKNQWPRDEEEKDDSRRYNGRRIYGAHHYLTDVEAQKGKLRAKDTLLLQEGKVQAEWYLWEGERPAIHSYAQKNGYIAIRYGDELFEVTNSKVDFRRFGVVEGKVQQALTIILEPHRYDPGNGRWGIHPDQSRNRLIFTSPQVRGINIPLSDWGLDFAENIPAPVLQAIQEARAGTEGGIESEEYRKRLQDKFGSRWSLKRFVKARGKEPSQPSTEVPGQTDAQIPSHVEGGEREAPQETGKESQPQKRVDKTIQRHRATDKKGPIKGTLGEAPVDVPRFRFARADAFSQPWHMALWAPNDPEGPCVLLNVDSHILQDVVRYHQDQYPDVHAEEVGDTVRKVFGEVAACKIAHSQKLAQFLPEEELDREYRSEGALTLALMGLLAEEAVIHQRLALRVGKHRAALKLVT